MNENIKNNKQKPKLLDGITIILIILNLGSYTIFIDKEYRTKMDLFSVSIITLFTLYVLSKFNKGFYWSRKLVLVFSGIAIINLITAHNYNIITQVFMFTKAIISVFLIYWLKTKNIKQYFIN